MSDYYNMSSSQTTPGAWRLRDHARFLGRIGADQSMVRDLHDACELINRYANRWTGREWERAFSEYWEVA